MQLVIETRTLLMHFPTTYIMIDVLKLLSDVEDERCTVINFDLCCAGEVDLFNVIEELI